MLPGKRFQLNERTLAIEVVESERRAVSIPAGAIIKVLSGNDAQTVDVLWENRAVEIFACDVNMRGTEITDRGARLRIDRGDMQKLAPKTQGA